VRRPALHVQDDRPDAGGRERQPIGLDPRALAGKHDVVLAAEPRERRAGARRTHLLVGIDEHGDEAVVAEVHRLESDQRKCAFLREVARATDAPARIHGARIEMFDPCLLSPVDAITSRALAPCPVSLNLPMNCLCSARSEL